MWVQIPSSPLGGKKEKNVPLEESEWLVALTILNALVGYKIPPEILSISISDFSFRLFALLHFYEEEVSLVAFAKGPGRSLRPSSSLYSFKADYSAFLIQSAIDFWSLRK
ncbi:MAG: hypothetical protein NTW46_01435 [Candidatus Nealsonbacteria bacterium]|nr:hypothetical protein [Candidatus Nealsonbacteria bacterium]